ncbi:4-hydroxyphenylacetate 3-monooxygenase, oxygenase component [Marinithermus hydrothermalis]|uniref:4-hydroxyphenylacetate 3-monooxygenase, oxygenase subunit n=1 Tax=Marinithermus hydrothermalis (strain DSM 14884 / JCM 11576 / T1) TaxID=869210 RepID=F2NK33_MARHT|nr:4-hydroxyphenylacetate 3-monooxygenase, oxygenase component [Marinithermus hydrothermalis]AEB12004.1 4-hydroxyphenylacetate 3-monooxygenase, oxygenase subunit [Marinithermus hydrothermalis DSM 14884]
MARTGQEYIEALKENPPNLWIKGEKVEDPTTHPAFKGVVQSMARLYDMQHDPQYKEVLTYTSPTSGKPVGMSFLEPKTREDLAKRSAAYKTWADQTLGMMGRTPDYLNAALTAYGMAADFFAQGDPRFGENVRNYYEYVRENDLCTTHALTNPQVNRGASPANQPDPYIPVGVVKQTAEGIIVRGARMLATLPVADELLVFPSTVLKMEPGNEKYALAFAIPTNTPGLHFICREPLAGTSGYDHPVSSRFEEMDAMCVFDDVLVPWERVFVLNNLEIVNQAYAATGALMHMAHQVVVHKVAKTEAFLGLVSLIAEGIGADAFSHVQEKIAEVIVYLETMKAFWAAAEAKAEVNAYGVMCPDRKTLDGARNLYPRLYQRIHEIVQQIGASGLIMFASEKDFESPLGPFVEKFMQGRNLPAREKTQLFRLAWDMTLSSFGARQALYERYFFGDPVRMHQALFKVYDTEPFKARIRAFLGWKHEEVGA